MVFKALLRVLPDLDVDIMHRRVIDGDFDTGRDLSLYSTEKLEGKRLAVIGYGHIGREVTKLGKGICHGRGRSCPGTTSAMDRIRRVQGAKQAMDQIFDAIQFRPVTNLKGDLPERYTDAGGMTVNGIGRVTPKALAAVASDQSLAGELRTLTEDIAAIWGALAVTDDPNRRRELIDRYGSRLILDSNRYTTLMEQLGLKDPYG